jgi:membrane-bound ClpP family serine protease
LKTNNKGLKAANVLPGGIEKYLRFYKMGLFFISIFGIYLGIQGLYLIIVENNYIPGFCLFGAALLISPPPIGISNMVARNLHMELTMGIKVGFSTLLLAIAVYFL